MSIKKVESPTIKDHEKRSAMKDQPKRKFKEEIAVIKH